MATITEKTNDWTVADLAKRFGPMPFWRIRQDPAPGTATEEDVEATYAANKRLCELVDGTLVEKTVGYLESYLAVWIATCLNSFVRPRRLGLVAGADGMFLLNPGLVRIPDVSFIAAERLPDRKIPDEVICPIIPDLAIEVLSRSNTQKEMDEKLADYFAAGVRLVWYVDPVKKVVRVYASIKNLRLIRESGTLDGGDVLPGFTVTVRELFAEPL